MKRLLLPLLLVWASPARAEYACGLHLYARHALGAIRLNGIPIVQTEAPRAALALDGLNRYLRPGVNAIELDFKGNDPQSVLRLEIQAGASTVVNLAEDPLKVVKQRVALKVPPSFPQLPLWQAESGPLDREELLTEVMALRKMLFEAVRAHDAEMVTSLTWPALEGRELARGKVPDRLGYLDQVTVLLGDLEPKPLPDLPKEDLAVEELGHGLAQVKAKRGPVIDIVLSPYRSFLFRAPIFGKVNGSWTLLDNP